MKYFFISLLLLMSSFGIAQPDLKVHTNEISQINELENIVREFNYTRNVSPKEVKIEGSAYLDEQFVEGIVALTTGVTYHKIPLRLNVYNEEIEFRNPRGTIFNINNPASIRELTIGKAKFLYTDIKSNKQTKKVLAEVIEEGNFSLLKHHRIRLTEPRAEQTHRAAQPPRLVKMPPEYLIRNTNGITVPIRNEKDLLAIVPEKKEEIKKLIRQRELSVKDEQDLVTLIRMLNQQ